MCIHSQSDAKWLLEYYQQNQGKERGLARFESIVKGYSDYYDDKHQVVQWLKNVLNEHLHPELVREKAQSYIDETNAKIEEDRAWAEQMKKLIPA